MSNRKNKWTVVYLHYGTLYNNENKWTIVVWNSMGESHKIMIKKWLHAVALFLAF